MAVGPESKSVIGEHVSELKSYDLVGIWEGQILRS